jgi:hypothetical protein
VLSITDARSLFQSHEFNHRFLETWLNVREDKIVPGQAEFDQTIGKDLSRFSIARVDSPDRVINIATSSVTHAVSGYDLVGQNYIERARTDILGETLKDRMWRQSKRPCGSFRTMPYADRRHLSENDVTFTYANMKILCLPVAPDCGSDKQLLYFSPEATGERHTDMFNPNTEHKVFGPLSFDFIDIGAGIDAVPFP